MNKEHVPVVHYRDGTRYVLGEAALSHTGSVMEIEGTISENEMTHKISGVIIGNANTKEEIEFPQPGLTIEDPSEHLGFMSRLAQFHHRSKS